MRAPRPGAVGSMKSSRRMTCSAEPSGSLAALGQHGPTAYAAMKEQLHRHAREAIDASAEVDANVRALWKSDETRARISAFLDALK